jgi:hypothetical protein
MARVHGAINVVSGLWPILHMRSFEWVFGPKVDRWLVYTVAGLLTSVGYAQWRAGTDEDWPHARRIGVATSSTLLLIDLLNVPRGRIRDLPHRRRGRSNPARGLDCDGRAAAPRFRRQR